MAHLRAEQDAKDQEVRADQDAVTTLLCLPEGVLLHILSFVESPSDTRSAFRTCRTLERSKDPFLMASWLLRHRCKDAMELGAMFGGSAVMLQQLQMGASATFRFSDELGMQPPPLVLATMHNFPDIVEILLSRDDVRADKAVVQIALRAAVQNNHWECVQALLAPHSPVSANSVFPEYGMGTTLIVAATFASVDVVKVLLSHGAHCTLRKSSGRTALHEACAYPGKDAFRKKIVQHLLKSDCSVLDKQDCQGNTPLLLAAQSNLPGCCEALLLAGSEAMYIASRDGYSPLGIFCSTLSRRQSSQRVYTKEVMKALSRYGLHKDN